jgi:hypothetical protein
MEWYRQVQFVSAVAMPPEAATAFGTTVNGMWADPERLSAEDVSRAHEAGRRVLADVQAPPSARIGASVPGVGVTRYRIGDRQVVHLLNYRYDEPTDTVAPVRDLRLRIPWSSGDAACTLLAPGVERPLDGSVAGATLEVEVPELHSYAALVIDPARPLG